MRVAVERVLVTRLGRIPAKCQVGACLLRDSAGVSADRAAALSRVVTFFGHRATPIAFFEAFMAKSYETLVDSDTRVDVNTIVAARRLQAVIGSRDYSIDVAEMVARIPRRRARCA